MAVQSKVPYRVTQKSLEEWLKINIGKDASGKRLWSYKSVNQNGNDWWQVTAPRLITEDEKEDMKIKDIKKKKETFEYDNGEDGSGDGSNAGK